MKLPILIIKGNSEVCYGIMQSFSEQLKNALQTIGEDVIYLDPNDDFITDYANREYKAVIAFMDLLFDNCMPGTDKALFDFYYGPKFNYWPDHPSVFYHQMNHTPKDYYILTQDKNYVKFINRYYGKAHAIFFPPGGKTADKIIPFEEREYDISFAGTYKNWKKTLGDIVFEDEIGIKLRDTYLEILCSQYDLTTEDAFTKALDRIGIHLPVGDYLELLNQMHWLADGVASAMFREKLISEILKNNLHVDVFGDSWYNSSFSSLIMFHPLIQGSFNASLIEYLFL